MGIQAITHRVFNVYKKVAHLLISKDVVTFLLCFLLAFIFWLSQASGSQRTTDLNIGIRYTDIPQDVELSSKLPNHIKVTVRDKGQNLIHYFWHDFHSLTIDLGKKIDTNKSGQIEVYSDALLPRIKTQLYSTSQIVSYSPKKITGAFVLLMHKKVPIVLGEKITLPNNKILQDSILFIPDSVVIYGTASSINSTQKIYATGLKSVISETGLYTLNLQAPSELIELSQSTVQVTIPLEQLTEKALMIPIVGLNFPKGKSLITFPQKIKVSFGVGLSRYQYILPEDFAITLDYTYLMNRESTMVPIFLSKHPDGLQNMKFDTQSVEFIIEG